MACKHLQTLFFISRLKHLKNTRFGALQSNSMLYHCAEQSSADQEVLPSEWYESASRKIKKLSCSLKNVDLIDGRLVNVNDDSTIIDERIEQKNAHFQGPCKSLDWFSIDSEEINRDGCIEFNKLPASGMV